MTQFGYHEAPADLAPATRELHRAVRSLIEEMDAIDWYDQRVDATHDDELRAILRHNRNEEVEHMLLLLEWIRSRDEAFGARMREYLFARSPTAMLAAEAERRAASPEAGAAAGLTATPTPGDGLTVGSLRGR